MVVSCIGFGVKQNSVKKIVDLSFAVRSVTYVSQKSVDQLFSTFSFSPVCVTSVVFAIIW
jgi:hypothetical protein